MYDFIPGQRCISDAESQMGLGTILKVEHLSLWYGDAQALDDIPEHLLQVEAGGFEPQAVRGDLRCVVAVRGPDRPRFG